MNQSNYRKFSILIFLMLLVGGLLSACGDVTTPTAITTTASTTTTVTSTTVVTTIAAPTSTPAPFIAANVNNPFSLPALTEVGIPTSLYKDFNSLAPYVSDPKITGYYSNQEADKLFEALQNALSNAGYSSKQSGLNNQKNFYTSLYVKPNNPDYLLFIAPAFSMSIQIQSTTQTNNAGQAFMEELKSKKTFVVVLAAPKIAEALVASQATATPAPTAIPVPPTATIGIDAKGFPIINGLKEVAAPSSVVTAFTSYEPFLKNTMLKVFISNEEPEKVNRLIATGLSNVGYTFEQDNSGYYNAIFTKSGATGIYVKLSEVFRMENLTKGGISLDEEGQRFFKDNGTARTMVAVYTITNIKEKIEFSKKNPGTPFPTDAPPITPTPAPPAIATSQAYVGYILEVTGTNGLRFTGSCLIVSANSSASQDATGTVPAFIKMGSGSIAACTLQKQSNGGETLKVRLLAFGSIKAEGETRQANGLVSVSGK